MKLITKFRVACRHKLESIWYGLWQRSDVGFRRMCVLASLHAQLVECHSSDQCAIVRLNERMNLVTDANAMKIPTLFAGVIWKTLPTVDRLDLNSERIVQRIKRLTPCWLHYGSDAKLESDIKSLLGFCTEVRATN